MTRRRMMRFFAGGGSVLLGTVIFAAPTDKSGDKSGGKPASPPAATNESPPAGEHKFLSAEDIQKIRRAELQPGDTARVQIPADVRRAYAAKAGITLAEFNAKTPAEQALDILGNGDASMRAAVKVMSDPSSIIEYKKIQQTILAGCGAAGCHGAQPGAAKTSSFLLHPAETDAASYTNFYILMHYSKKISQTGAFGGTVEHRLVERGRGDESLLVQFGLPPGKADYPHPRVANFKPVFGDLNDPRLRRLSDWMDHSLSRIEPDYQIEPSVNGNPPATVPAHGPASQPTTKPRGR